MHPPLSVVNKTMKYQIFWEQSIGEGEHEEKGKEEIRKPTCPNVLLFARCSTKSFVYVSSHK